MMHIHEFFAHVDGGVAGGWPAERCLGSIPEEEARKLLRGEELTVTPHGVTTGVTTWREMPDSHETCWLSGRGFVI
jgi:hypothetical protein